MAKKLCVLALALLGMTGFGGAQEEGANVGCLDDGKCALDVRDCCSGKFHETLKCKSPFGNRCGCVAAGECAIKAADCCSGSLHSTLTCGAGLGGGRCDGKGASMTSGGSSSASITVTDECAEKQENCKATVDKIDCPTSEPQPLNFKFDGSAKALEDLDTADVEITAKLGPIQVLKKTVSACGQQSIDLPLGAGTIGLDLLKCPVKSGDEQQITGSVAATQALPGGTKLTVTITATDKQQNKVVDLSVLVQGEKEDEKHVVPETNIWVKLGQVYGDATIQKEESNAAQTFIV